jgi:hypothetical protein
MKNTVLVLTDTWEALLSLNLKGSGDVLRHIDPEYYPCLKTISHSVSQIHDCIMLKWFLWGMLVVFAQVHLNITCASFSNDEMK